MWVDLIGIAILAILVVVGIVRGTVPTLLRILALAGAYVAGVFAATSFPNVVAQQLGLPEFLGAPAAGVAGFFATYLVLGFGVRIFGWWDKQRRDGEPLSTLDRFGGGVLGGIQGAAVVLLLGVLGNFIDAGQSAGSLSMLPPVNDSKLSQASQTVLEKGAEAMVDPDDAGARVAVKMMTRPKQTVESAQALMDNPRLDALQEDRLFWSYVENGAVDAGLNRASFLGMAHDEATRRNFADLGLISEEEASDPRLFRDAMHDVFEEVGPRVKKLRDDPEVANLLNDPEVAGALAAGDTLTLLQNPSIRSLVDRVMTGDSDG